MKNKKLYSNLLPGMLVFLFLFSGSIQAQKTKLFAANCHKYGGRCSGDAYCTACKNCSGCKNCNSGGTCGVCTSYTKPVKTVYKKPTNNTINSFKSSSTSTTTKAVKGNSNTKKSSSKYTGASFVSDELLHVVSEKLSLRDGPGTNYPIIEQLKKDDALQFIGNDGEWIQVIVLESKNIGYVKLDFVR